MKAHRESRGQIEYKGVTETQVVRERRPHALFLVLERQERSERQHGGLLQEAGASEAAASLPRATGFRAEHNTVREPSASERQAPILTDREGMWV